MRHPFPPALIALALVAGWPAAAQAQTALDGRVDRLEREMRAVQRKVFPGGSGPVVDPQASPPPGGPAPGSPIAGPVTALEQRVTTLEGGMTELTGQIEQLQNQQRQLQDAFNAYKRSTDARLKAIEDTLTSTGGGAAGAGTGGDVAAPPPVKSPPAKAPPAKAPPKDAAADAPKPAPKPGADPARAAKVAAVQKPDTGNAAEDQYTYGYRLWQGKFYPEARTQLGAVVTKFPKDRRASYAQNLLGRSFYDEGDYKSAAKAFYENYQKMPEGERAADSLFWLSKTMQKLKAAPAQICQVYGAIDSEYAGKMGVDQQAEIDRGKADAKCK